MAIQTPTENWFKFPNHIADNLQDYNPYELKILVFMLRRTVGMLGLTATPDQRFSISFLAKNTKLSESQVSKSKKTMLQKGIIIEDGIADDGSKLYAVSWDTPSIERPLPSNRDTPSPQCGEPPLLNAETDKDSSLKTIEENTLDASASSAAPEKSKSTKKKKFQRKDYPHIPFQEIADHYKKKHKEFRKTEPFYLPYKEDPKIVELWDILESKEKIYEAIDAFIEYLKSGKSSESFLKNAPIMPSQMPNCLNQSLPYWPSASTRPKLEIKKYEQTGKYIGPMPEGW